MKYFLFLFLIFMTATPCLSKEAPLLNRPTQTLEKPLACDDKNSAECLVYVPAAKSGAIVDLSLEKVVDGDTLIASGETIRLWGINAEEEGEPFYEREKLLLATLTSHGRLTCKLFDVDRYKINIMQCMIDGLDLGAMMVRTGMAKELKNYSGGYYSAYEDMAKKEHLGIWKNVQ